jgi:hypothetical protein
VNCRAGRCCSSGLRSGSDRGFLGGRGYLYRRYAAAGKERYNCLFSLISISAGLVPGFRCSLCFRVGRLCPLCLIFWPFEVCKTVWERRNFGRECPLQCLPRRHGRKDRLRAQRAIREARSGSGWPWMR